MRVVASVVVDLVCSDCAYSLSPELPIDVVYTWVNGSDPKLLAELRELKRKLKKYDSP